MVEICNEYVNLGSQAVGNDLASIRSLSWFVFQSLEIVNTNRFGFVSKSI